MKRSCVTFYCLLLITPFILAQEEGITVENSGVGIGTISPNADLDVFNASNAFFRLSNSTSNFAEFREIGTQFRINNYSASQSLIDVNPKANDGTSNQAFRLFRESNSTGVSYMDLFIGDGTNTLNSRLAGSGTNSFINAYDNSWNLGVGTNIPTAQLHVKSGQPTGEHTIIAQSDNPSTNYTSTYAGLYIRNSNNTNDNYARLNFGDSSNTAGSVGVQIKDHGNDYGDLVFWTRGSAGFSEKMRIDQVGTLMISSNTHDLSQIKFNPPSSEDGILRYEGRSQSILTPSATDALQLGISPFSTSRNIWLEASDNGLFAQGSLFYLNQGLSTEPAVVEIGRDRSGNGNSYIDLHSSASTDYDARMIRASGANGDLDIVNKGTGALRLYANDLEKVRITSTGNIGFNTANFGTSASNVIGIAEGTEPTSSPVDMVQLFASVGESSGSELRVRDEAGNVTTLSPHNFSLIGKPSHEMAWSYYSEKDGKAINVDMFRVVQLLEELTGEKLIHISDLKEAIIQKE